MNTPIYDFVKKYRESKALRMHMPGHKGKDFLGLESMDITEINGADVLYAPTGIIKESEENAAHVFGSAKTIYSTEGSSLSIKAMLHLTLLYAKAENKAPKILAARNVHKAFINGVALLGLDVEWIYPEESEGFLSCLVSANELEHHLANSKEKPVALYITSPDYPGNICDIEALSQVCKKHGVLLLVDNAHGAYLNFLPQSAHPIALGADMCCDSAHKTLPVLTGGGYLHISHNAPKMFCELSDEAFSLFASTSPSYLILQSLDLANKYLSENYREKLLSFCEKVFILKKKLRQKGYALLGNEPLKITVCPKSYGYKGDELGACLEDNNIYPEFADSDYLVLMLTPEHTEEDLQKIEDILLKISQKNPLFEKAPQSAYCEKALSIRDAVMSLSEEVDVEKSLGRVLAAPCVNCPPAVPIAISGEVINQDTIKAFKYYGYKKIKVVK